MSISTRASNLPISTARHYPDALGQARRGDEASVSQWGVCWRRRNNGVAIISPHHIFSCQSTPIALAAAAAEAASLEAASIFR